MRKDENMIRLRNTPMWLTLFMILAVPRADVKAQISTDALLDTLQRGAFNFFWTEANPGTGLIRDRGPGTAPSSIASVGFGLTALCIGVDHGWQTRSAVADRVFATLQTFWNSPQGSGASGYGGYKGFFYHFLDMDSAVRTWDSELSTIDTGLLLAGIIYVREYFDQDNPVENQIRALADSVYRRADWEWFRNYQDGLSMEWKPDTKFRGLWRGYNESMIMYILGYGSPTHPLQKGWQYWTSGYVWATHYGQTYVEFPPLFGHQYSHCWVDFRGIQDAYMRGKGIDYFENSRRATLAQRAYCAANPGGWAGYSDTLWGITASDSPTGYSARGAPPAQGDDGTLVPTAPISSIPFAPEVVIPTIHNMWNTYGPQLWTSYGFTDAFNLTQNWWGPDVIGIDQGPIIIMIENYRTGKVWETFMKNPYIQTGLSRIGFTPVVSVKSETTVPAGFRLGQNYPNPFNPSTTIEFEIPERGHVTLTVSDALGRLVDVLADGVLDAGTHTRTWKSGAESSGLYIYQLRTTAGQQSMPMILMK